MSFNRAAMAVVLLAGAGLAGCSTASKVLGGGSAPDEFRTVASAPLVVPPDYSLRPPKPGEPRPQELQPESAARVAMLQQRQGEVRSDGEKLLVQRAGADKADPLVRYVVDDEFGDLAHKDKGFADWVMFWKHGQPAAPQSGLGDPNQTAPIDASTEEARLQKLTGGRTVIIARQGDSKLKLPGL